MPTIGRHNQILTEWKPSSTSTFNALVLSAGRHELRWFFFEVSTEAPKMIHLRYLITTKYETLQLPLLLLLAQAKNKQNTANYFAYYFLFAIAVAADSETSIDQY